jgi:hypothetical protein
MMMLSTDNTLILSLYLIGHDLSLKTDTGRAEFYTKLCLACRLINEQLQNKGLWSCGGDGVVFGVHCADSLDANSEPDESDAWHDHLHDIIEGINPHRDECLPHLRGICRYGNDVNDAWRAISYMLEISSLLSSRGIHCAIECMDQDGQLLLIEAAEVLPSWVDEDISMGGVGGPCGCANRCWVVDGRVRLIPPLLEASNRKPNDVQLGRGEALELLRCCTGTEEYVLDEVQQSIETRIARIDYSIPKREKPNYSGEANHDKKQEKCSEFIRSSHFHITAAAVPASVAYFLQNHPESVPFLVDSFCNVAQKYMDERFSEKKMSNPKKGSGESHDKIPIDEATSLVDECTPIQTKIPNPNPLGKHITFERIVLIPITMTRTNYAELITGRGTNPAFPIPKEYRSVELNRFQRQLHQRNEERNVWRHAVDVGVRLCAGLEWIMNGDTDCAKNEGKDASLLSSMSDVERRVRLYWCRIDAEARSTVSSEVTFIRDTTSWIEKTWRAGPNDKSERIHTDALQQMSKCRVFDPELSKPPHEEPCPLSRSGVSLRNLVKSGINQALRWVDKECNQSSFSLREWEVDEDAWMDVHSLEELEDEMRNLSSTADQTSKAPRRTTRRSRRNLMFENDHSEAQDVKSINKMLHGFKSLVDGEGELGGVVTRQAASMPSINRVLPQQAVSEPVIINPRCFLSILRDKLRTTSSDSDRLAGLASEDEVTKYFFKEDLEDDSCDSDSSTQEVMVC